MEVDLVDPVTVAVVGAQPRRVLVRQRPPLLHLRGPGGPSEPRQLGEALVPHAGIQMPLDRLHQRPVGAEDVVLHQRGSLIGHAVRGACHAHERTPWYGGLTRRSGLWVSATWYDGYL
ncbi:hypothetical protein GCM10023238_07490 [Streptomyces heliomycini]